MSNHTDDQQPSDLAWLAAVDGDDVFSNIEDTAAELTQESI